MDNLEIIETDVRNTDITKSNQSDSQVIIPNDKKNTTPMSGNEHIKHSIAENITPLVSAAVDYVKTINSIKAQTASVKNACTLMDKKMEVLKEEARIITIKMQSITDSKVQLINAIGRQATNILAENNNQLNSSDLKEVIRILTEAIKEQANKENGYNNQL